MASGCVESYVLLAWRSAGWMHHKASKAFESTDAEFRVTHLRVNSIIALLSYGSCILFDIDSFPKAIIAELIHWTGRYLLAMSH